MTHFGTFVASKQTFFLFFWCTSWDKNMIFNVEPESKEGKSLEILKQLLKLAMHVRPGEKKCLELKWVLEFKTVSHFHITALSSFCVESVRNGKVTK